MRVAGPHDLFLHVRGTPGAHVIVPLNRGEDVPQETLLDAATLAVHYSKMRTAAAADVTYTPRKFVSKPRGAKPGLVSVHREKVMPSTARSGPARKIVDVGGRTSRRRNESRRPGDDRSGDSVASGEYRDVSPPVRRPRGAS